MKFIYLLQAVLLAFAKSSDKSKYFNGPKPGVNGVFDLPLPKDGVRVGIFGDSLTEETWGPVLEKMLNNDTSKNIKTKFQLLDFAKGGVTVLDAPVKFLTIDGILTNELQWDTYKNSTKWKSAQKSEPDIAIFMIGTNDYRGDVFEFKDNTKEKWRQGYEEYVKKIKKFESKPQVYLMSTPPVLDSCCHVGEHTYQAHVGGDILNPMVQQIAEEYNVNFLDLYAFFGGNDPKKQLALCKEQPHFPKDCNADHYGVDHMAQFVFDNIIKKTDARIQMNKGSTQPETDLSQIIPSLVQKTGAQQINGKQFRQN